MAQSPEFLDRHFTNIHRSPYEMFRWVERTVEVRAVTFPEAWGQAEIELMVKHVFLPEEHDVREVFDRVANTITKVGFENDYFATEAEADVFHDELKYLLVTQQATFAMKIWQNVGVVGKTLLFEASSHGRQWRISDIFMRAVEANGEWYAQEVPEQTGKARQIWQDIVRDVWQYNATSVEFVAHTKARQVAKETLPIDVPSATLQLLFFVSDDGEFAIDEYQQASKIMTIALDILLDYSQGATPEETAYLRTERPIALGFNQLAAVLQAMAVAYDSDTGRAVASGLSALLTGYAYEASATLAERKSPFQSFTARRGKVSRLLRAKKEALEGMQAGESGKAIIEAAQHIWTKLAKTYKETGLRHSSVTAIIHEGSLGRGSLMPYENPTVTLQLPTGGSIDIVRQTIATALKKLHYTKEQATDIINHLHAKKKIEASPHLRLEDMAIFKAPDDTAPRLKMLHAVQTFITGNIHQPLTAVASTTPRDIEHLLVEAWQSGTAFIEIAREGAEMRLAEPVVEKQPPEELKEEVPEFTVENTMQTVVLVQKTTTVRELPRIRQAKTFSFKIADSRGYFTVGEYDDGTPGEVFLHLAKAEPSLAGTLDALARTFSHGLQHGVPLKVYVKSLFNMNFAPQGITDDPEVPEATSIIDYVVRRIALHYLLLDERIALGLESSESAEQKVLERQLRLVDTLSH